MHDALRWLEFVRLSTFERQAKGLLSEDEIQEIEQAIVENPTAAPVIRGTGGVRKLRFALANRGKSAGVRVIYYHRDAQGRVYLITVYPKNEKDDLTDAERKTMKQLTALIDQEA